MSRGVAELRQAGGSRLHVMAAAGGVVLATGLVAVHIWAEVARGTFEVGSLLVAVVGALFAGVGGLLVARRGGNAVGWTCLAGGLLWLLNIANAGVNDLALERFSTGDAWVVWSAWLAMWLYLPSMAALGFFLPATFPTGMFLSPRWRHLSTMLGVLLTAGAVTTVLRPGPIPSTDGALINPTGIDALTGLPDPETIAGLIPVMLVLGVISVVARFRRSAGVERTQIKWFLAAVAAVACSIPLILAMEAAGWVPHMAGDWLLFVAMTLVPCAIGVAVLRYGLYEIDRIVSRAVTYAVITGVLIGSYAGAVVLFGQVLAPLTADSEVAVAASTLLVAALFQPVRRRVQGLVDRRFNRARYDAQRSVEAFRAQLRQQVGLEDVSTDLVATVGATLQPASMTLWLRPVAEPQR